MAHEKNNQHFTGGYNDVFIINCLVRRIFGGRDRQGIHDDDRYIQDPPSKCSRGRKRFETFFSLISTDMAAILKSPVELSIDAESL